MARKSADDPSGWYGTRTASYMAQCGFCAAPTTLGDTALPDGQHACLHELPYFDKLWICSCECNSEWKPYAIVVEKDGSIGAAPENLVVAEYMTQKAKKKQAKEAAAAEAKAKEEETEQDT